MSMTKLNEQQRMFVEEYVMNGRNAHRAALSAGYAPTTAQTESALMVKRPDIHAVIKDVTQRIDERLAEKLMITVADKAELLSRILYDIVPKDPTQPILRPYYREAMKAIQELNKMQGHYAPDKSIRLTANATKESIAEVKRVYEDY